MTALHFTAELGVQYCSGGSYLGTGLYYRGGTPVLGTREVPMTRLCG